MTQKKTILWFFAAISFLSCESNINNANNPNLANSANKELHESPLDSKGLKSSSGNTAQTQFSTCSGSGYLVSGPPNPTFVDEGDGFISWFTFLDIDHPVDVRFTNFPPNSYTHANQLWYDEWDIYVSIPSNVAPGPKDVIIDFYCYMYEHRIVVRETNAAPLGTIYNDIMNYAEITSYDLYMNDNIRTADFDCESYTCKINYNLFYGILLGSGGNGYEDKVTIRIKDRITNNLYYQKTYTSTTIAGTNENEIIINFNTKYLKVEVELHDMISDIQVSLVDVTEGT